MMIEKQVVIYKQKNKINIYNKKQTIMGALIPLILVAATFILVIYKMVTYKHDSTPTPGTGGGGGGVDTEPGEGDDIQGPGPGRNDQIEKVE